MDGGSLNIVIDKLCLQSFQAFYGKVVSYQSLKVMIQLCCLFRFIFLLLLDSKFFDWGINILLDTSAEVSKFPALLTRRMAKFFINFCFPSIPSL